MPGVYVYVTLISIISNLHVLKFSHVFYQAAPIPLGTIPMATSFLATDILVEFHGKREAKRAVDISLAGMVFFYIAMLSAVAVAPLSPAETTALGITDLHAELTAIFTPGVAIVTASLIAFYVSEVTDVYVYAGIKNVFKRSPIWVRSGVSSTISAFLDTALFSFLAFMLFTNNPVTLNVLFKIYILGGFLPRVFLAFLNVPLIYSLKKANKS